MQPTTPTVTILAFKSPHCPPCRALAPVLTELEARYRGRVEVRVIDSEEDPDTANAYGIRGVPTLLATKDGAVVAQQTGYAGKARVEAWFAALAE